MRFGNETGAGQGRGLRVRRRAADVRRSRRQAFSAGLALVLVATLAIPAGLTAKEKGKSKKNSTAAAVNLVWPAPPQRPRIRYLGLISTVDDVKENKKSNWIDRGGGVRG